MKASTGFTAACNNCGSVIPTTSGYDMPDGQFFCSPCNDKVSDTPETA